MEMMGKRNRYQPILKKKMFGMRLKAYDHNLGFIVNYEWISDLPRALNFAKFCMVYMLVERLLRNLS